MKNNKIINIRGGLQYFEDFTKRFQNYEKTGLFRGWDDNAVNNDVVSVDKLRRIIGIRFRIENGKFAKLIEKHGVVNPGKYVLYKINFDSFIKEYFVILNEQFKIYG